MAPMALGSLATGTASSQPTGSEDAMLIGALGHQDSHGSRPHASAISLQRGGVSPLSAEDSAGKQELSPSAGGAAAVSVRMHAPASHPPAFSGQQEQFPSTSYTSEEDTGQDSEIREEASGQLEADSELDSNDAPSDDMDVDSSGAATHVGHKGRFFDAPLLNGTEEYDSEEGELDFSQMTFCRNCTGSLFDPYCSACGHHTSDDAALFDRQLSISATQPPAMSAAAGPVALLWDERMEAHEEGRPNPHPERPDRIRAVMARLHATGLTDQCVRVDCQEATLEQLSCVHTPDLMEFVKAMALGLPPPASYATRLLTPDTYINSSTYSCARLAAGGAAAVAAMVARGEATQGAAIVRPPGHHAESNMAMGFCFFNNAAVAARAAQAAGAQRVLILDWDIHHGNGTQHIFENDPSVMYMSLHRWDSGSFYPGTGSPEEVGQGAGMGYTVNVAWNGGNLHNTDYMSAFDRVLMPVARSYRPDLIIVSAGFDAADGDPIGGCRVTPECFAHMTAALKSLAPLVLLLEGGYNLAATAHSTEACLRVLLGQQPPPLPGPPGPSRAGALGIVSSLHVHRRFWPCLRPIYAQSVQELLMLRGATEISDVGASPGLEQLPSMRAAAICAPPPASLVPSQGVPPLVAARNAAAGSASAMVYGRKRQLIQQIRKRAQQAWWRRHKRVVKARAMSTSGTPVVLLPQAPRRGSI